MANSNAFGSAQPYRRINYFQGRDFQCSLLASLGFSTQFIQAQTGLSVGQVQYRLRRAEIKRSDYRNGASSLSGSVMRTALPLAEPAVREHLKQVVVASSNETARQSGQAQNIIESCAKLAVSQGTQAKTRAPQNVNIQSLEQRIAVLTQRGR